MCHWEASDGKHKAGWSISYRRWRSTGLASLQAPRNHSKRQPLSKTSWFPLVGEPSELVPASDVMPRTRQCFCSRVSYQQGCPSSNHRATVPELTVFISLNSDTTYMRAWIGNLHLTTKAPHLIRLPRCPIQPDTAELAYELHHCTTALTKSHRRWPSLYL